MARSISRRRDETWRDAAVRIGNRFELGDAVARLYDEMIGRGASAADAAFHACMDLDCVELFEPDGSSPD